MFLLNVCSNCININNYYIIDLFQARTQSEIDEVTAVYSSTSSRPDININCDEVRAAMAGFSLPPSAIPSWAANIPESQWTSTLTQQIQRIQSNTTPREN